MTRRQFLKTDEMKKIRTQIITCAIACYVIAAISVAFGYYLYGTFETVVDAVLLIFFGLLIHLLQSRVAAILLAIYAIFNCIVMSIEMGQLAGWWGCIVGVYAVIYTFKFQKAWKEYKNSPEARMI